MPINPFVYEAIFEHVQDVAQAEDAGDRNMPGELVVRNDGSREHVIVTASDAAYVAATALYTKRLVHLEFTGCIMENETVISALASFLDRDSGCPTVRSLTLGVCPIVSPCRISSLECISRASSNTLETLILSGLHFSCRRSNYLFRNSISQCTGLKRLELHDAVLWNDTASTVREVLESLTEKNGSLEWFDFRRPRGTRDLSGIADVLIKKSSKIFRFLIGRSFVHLPPNYLGRLTRRVRNALRTNNTVLLDVNRQLRYVDEEIDMLIKRNKMIARAVKIVAGRSNRAPAVPALVRFCRMHPVSGASPFFFLFRELIQRDNGTFLPHTYPGHGVKRSKQTIQQLTGCTDP